MRTIKNFFHNVNDVVLAFLIVVVAAGIVYWRMGIIMDYPRQIAAQNAVYLQDDDADTDEAADEAADDAAAEDADDAAAEEAADAEGAQG